jgi:hypothetical protein
VLAGGRELAFGGSVDQVVLHLGGDGYLLTPVVGDPQDLGDQPGGVVRQPDVADLALPDVVVVRGQGLLEWRVWIGVVGVVEVGAEAAQARRDLTDDVAAGQPAVVDIGPDDAVGLGGDHHLVAATAEGVAEDPLDGFAFGTGPGRRGRTCAPFPSADFTRRAFGGQHDRSRTSSGEPMRTCTEQYAQEFALQSEMYRPSAYDLIVICNFLTNTSFTTEFKAEIRELSRSLTPGGILLVLVGTGGLYPQVLRPG